MHLKPENADGRSRLALLDLGDDGVDRSPLELVAHLRSCVNEYTDPRAILILDEFERYWAERKTA